MSVGEDGDGGEGSGGLGLVWRNRQLDLALLPWCLHNPKASILKILTNKIGKFDSELQGIVISYKNIKVLNNLGTIRQDSAEIHMDIKVDFHVFQPKVGSKLYGVINKKCVTHLSVLVHKIFNVVIPRPTDDLHTKWIGDQLEVGQKIPFIIVVLDLFGALPYIRGDVDESSLNTWDTEDNEVYIYDTQGKLAVAKVNFDATKPKVIDSPKKESSLKRKLSTTGSDEPDAKKSNTKAEIKLNKSLEKDAIPQKNRDKLQLKKSNPSSSDSSSDSDIDLSFRNQSVQSDILKKMIKEKGLKTNLTSDVSKKQRKTSKETVLDNSAEGTFKTPNKLSSPRNSVTEEVMSKQSNISSNAKPKINTNDSTDSTSSDEDIISRRSTILSRLKFNLDNATKNKKKPSTEVVKKSPKSVNKNATKSNLKNQNSSDGSSSEEDMLSKKSAILRNLKSSMIDSSDSSSTSDEDIIKRKSAVLQTMQNKIDARNNCKQDDLMHSSDSDSSSECDISSRTSQILSKIVDSSFSSNASNKKKSNASR